MAGIAQLVERPVVVRDVKGSNPFARPRSIVQLESIIDSFLFVSCGSQRSSRLISGIDFL